MDNHLKSIGNRVYYTESMRELGAARFVLGGVILLFGLFFLWIELYIPGVLISGFAVLLMEHCTEVIIDKENRLLIKKTGWIKPFLTLKTKSLEGVVSLSIESVSTRRKGFGQVMSGTSVAYKLNFNFTGKKLHINTFTEKTKASAYATEIARFLEIEFINTKSKQKKLLND
ncbi:MAG: hypothetical protein U0W24_14335 [Bacteroidales bacterium]